MALRKFYLVNRSIPSNSKNSRTTNFRCISILIEEDFSKCLNRSINLQRIVNYHSKLLLVASSCIFHFCILNFQRTSISHRIFLHVVGKYMFPFCILNLQHSPNNLRKYLLVGPNLNKFRKHMLTVQHK